MKRKITVIYMFLLILFSINVYAETLHINSTPLTGNELGSESGSWIFYVDYDGEGYGLPWNLVDATNITFQIDKTFADNAEFDFSYNLAYQGGVIYSNDTTGFISLVDTYDGGGVYIGLKIDYVKGKNDIISMGEFDKSLLNTTLDDDPWEFTGTDNYTAPASTVETLAVDDVYITPNTSVYTTNDLTAFCNGTDYYNYSLEYSYNWYINDVKLDIFDTYNWTVNDSIKNGLPDFGDYTYPRFDVFDKDNISNLIVGKIDGTYSGYQWNNTDWVENTTLVNGLGDVGIGGTTHVFKYENEYNLFIGNNSLGLFSYKWNGTGWETNTTFQTGISKTNFYVKSETFIVDDVLHLIYGEQDGTFKGYTWDDTTWNVNTSLVSGLGDVGDNSDPSIIQYGDELYLISGETDGLFNSFKWNGTSWESNDSIKEPLGDIGDRSRLSTFYRDNQFYLIASQIDSTWYSYQLNNNVLPSNEISAFDNVTLECNINNGWEIQKTNSSELTILNSIPTVNSVFLEPNTSVYNSNDIEGYCNFSDADSDTIKFDYIWYKDGAVNTSGSTTVLVSADENINVVNLSNVNTTKDDAWILSCRANDTHNISAYTNSSELTILNTPPTFDYAYITPNTSVAVDDDLLGHCAGTDLDTDSLEYSYNWYIDDVSMDIDNINLFSVWTSTNDVVKFECIISDGDIIVKQNSTEISIGNTGPTIDSVYMVPNISIYSNTSIRGYCNASDIDGDNLTYVYDWFVNDENILFNDTWVRNDSLVSGFSDQGSDSKSSIFEYESQYHLVVGAWSGIIQIYTWDGSSWSRNTTMETGVTSDIGTMSAPTTFYVGDTLNLVVAGNEEYNGFTWTGSTWVTNSTLESGLDIEWYATPIAFTLDDELKMIVSDSFVIHSYDWNGAGWTTNNTVKSGLVTAGIGKLTVYEYNNQVNAIMGANSANAGYTWSGSAWVSNSTILEGISGADENQFSAWEYGGNINLVVGHDPGTYYAYTLYEQDFLNYINLDRDDEVIFQCAVSDDLLTIAENSTTNTVGNLAPVITNISINETIYNNETITINITIEENIDNDEINYTIQLYNSSNNLLSTFYSVDEISTYINSSLTKDNIYYINVTGNDSELESNTYQSNNITILNTITNPGGYLYTNTTQFNLLLNSYTDIDNDTLVINETRWIINGLHNTTFDNQSYLNFDDITTSDNISCNFSIYDTAEISSLINTSNTTLTDDFSPILENFSLSASSGSGSFSIYVDTYDLIGNIATGYPKVAIYHSVNGYKTILDMALSSGNTYYTAYSTQESSGSYSFIFYSEDDSNNNVFNDTNGLLFTIQVEDSGSSGGGGGSTVIINGETDFELSPEERTISISPGSERILEFEVKNKATKDLSFVVTEASDFIEFNDGEYNNVEFDIPFESGITSNSKFVRFYVRIPEGTDLGEYDEELIVKSDGITKTYKLKVIVDDSFLTSLMTLINKPVYTQEYCAAEFQFTNATKIKDDDCSVKKNVNITLGFIIFIILSIAILVFFNIRKKKK